MADIQGLASDEAARRLAHAGPNELPRAPRRGPLRIALGVLAEPMFLLLALAAAIYLAIGDLGEGLMLAGFAALTVALVVFQEARSEKALEALRALGAPVARVVRDGRELRIPAREVVAGDVLLVSEGERVAADAVLRRCDSLALDESVLTGESVPVRKRARDGDVEPAAPGGDDRPWIYAGTLAVAGHGVAEVVATGVATQAGRIGLSLATIEQAPTLLQRTIGRLVRLFGAIALAASALLLLLYGLLRGNWLDGTLAAIALAMAMLPEEFPMALAVFLALGAWRLAQVQVLVRRPAVVETLGAASVLCVDKTGTLTENRMRVRALVAGGTSFELERRDVRELPEAFHRVLEYGVLASKRRAVDPMDQATASLGDATLAGTEHLHAEWPLEREYGITPELPALSRVWRRADGRAIVAAKGAPEAIATLCRLDDGRRAALLAQVEALARRGLRVLAVASGELEATAAPDSPRELALAFEGLLAFEDPLRPGVPAAVAAAHAAGMAVAMVTGDYPATALAIAREAGIDASAGALTGTELVALDDAGLRDAVRTIRVFARIRPEQKLTLVRAFAADGAVVAMTGDGVNDAPALKAAHIGLAMGSRATDVAREAAGIVLLADDFGRIVDGVRLGRRIFDNLRKVLMYIAAIHLPIAGLALLPVAFGLPPLLLPVHVVFTEMVIDPICSIAFESMPAEADAMRRPPRRPDERLIDLPQLALAFVQGTLLLAATLALYVATLGAGVAPDEARALAFTALTAGNLMLVRVAATRSATLSVLFAPGHRAFWWVAAVAAAVVALAISVPAVAGLFHFAPPALPAVLGAAALGAASVLPFDLLKRSAAVRRVLGGHVAAR
ncbi:MAG TPA: cation-translocating P-type ATPase [Xanthomonadales bacterium]|nr:cation-translocating P-type ATPase [Xanthomonadales bacterium]